MKKINNTALFLALTFLLSYGAAAVFRISGGTLGSVGGTVFSVFYMFIPFLSSLIIVKLVQRREIQSDLLISFRFNAWFIVAWLTMPLLAFVTIGVSLLFPDVTFSAGMEGMIRRYESMLSPEQLDAMRQSLKQLPVHPIWITLVSGLVAGVTINAVAGFGEEAGWRGFLLTAFRNMSFTKASLLIGFVWGLWHAPLVLMGHNYPQHPEIGVAMMTVWCMLLTPFFLYVTLRARSVLAAAIAHGTLNGTAAIALMVIDGGDDLTVGMTGLAGFITLAIFTLVLTLYDLRQPMPIMRGPLGGHLFPERNDA